MRPSAQNPDDTQPLSQLNHIKGKKITKREIDIIACLICARASSIASFLSISARTVETHLHNIMLKLECNSREGIIDFIERSNKLPQLKAHYEGLVVNYLFEKTLKMIGGQIKEKRGACTLYNANASPEYMALMHTLTKHLKLLGFEVTPKSHKELASFEVMASAEKGSIDQKTFTLSVLSREEYDTQGAEGGSRSSYENEQSNANAQIYIRLDQNDHVNNTQTLKNIRSEFFACSTYHDAVFTLLKKLYLAHNFEPFIAGFKTKLASISQNRARSTDRTSTSAEIMASACRSENSSIWRVLHDKATQRRTYASTYIFLFVLIVATGLFFWRSSNHHDADSSLITSNQSVRSDFRVPVETAFLDRPILVKQLNDHFKKETPNKQIKVVGLVGIGGAGKTTLARAYAKVQTNAVVWEINAETHTSLIDSFMNLGYTLAKTKEHKEELIFIKSIQNGQEKEKQLIAFVKGQLKNQRKWFLVYDNVEAFSQIKEFFPHDVATWGEGNVIITTRDGNILNSTHVGETNVIQIDQLTPDEALTLFCKILYQKDPKELVPEEQERVREFLTKIPPFPLDVSVASYYIRSAGITLDHYRERVAQNSQAFDKGQQIFVKEISDYTQTRYGLITLSITKLIELNPEYKELLLLICLLDSQDIPLILLAFYKDPVLVDQFLHDLKKYSLITSQNVSEIKKTGGTFSLHRSTQMLAQKFLFDKMGNDESKILLDQYILMIKRFYKNYIGQNYENLLLLIPHLETILKNFENMRFSQNTKTVHELDLSYVLGYLYFSGSRSHIQAKHYFLKIIETELSYKHFSSLELAILLKDFGEISVSLNDLEQVYSEKSIQLCKNIPDSNLLVAENLQTIGDSYRKRDNFEQADLYLKTALTKISSLKDEQKAEIESKIYDRLGWLYCVTFINNYNSEKSKEYLLKSLKILNADHLFYNASIKPSKKLSCLVAMHKLRLGVIYNRLGDYKNAFIQGFRETGYILDNSLDNCSHNIFLKGRVYEGAGEALLREGDIAGAEQKLSEAINIIERLVGSSLTLVPRSLRVEARIRQRKLIDALEDCLFVIKITQREKNNFHNLLYLTNFYHAAVIKQKQNDPQKSYEHFKDFFEKIKPLCKVILTEQKYQLLEEKKVFEISPYQKSNSKDIIKHCFGQSALIFSTIYGAEHPFVRDYVMLNNNAVHGGT